MLSSIARALDEQNPISFGIAKAHEVGAYLVDSRIEEFQYKSYLQFLRQTDPESAELLWIEYRMWRSGQQFTNRPIIGFEAREEVGMGVVNIDAVKKLTKETT